MEAKAGTTSSLAGRKGTVSSVSPASGGNKGLPCPWVTIPHSHPQKDETHVEVKEANYSILLSVNLPGLFQRQPKGSSQTLTHLFHLCLAKRGCGAGVGELAPFSEGTQVTWTMSFVKGSVITFRSSGASSPLLKWKLSTTMLVRRSR